MIEQVKKEDKAAIQSTYILFSSLVSSKIF